jgi:hypothetical protein
LALPTCAKSRKFVAMFPFFMIGLIIVTHSLLTVVNPLHPKTRYCKGIFKVFLLYGFYKDKSLLPSKLNIDRLECLDKDSHTYHTRAIISHGLYNFYFIFHCGLYCKAVNITDNLYTKQGNSSIFEPKIHGL